MKTFFTSFFATLSALIVFVVGSCLIGLLLIGALAALSAKKPIDLQEGSYLVFDLAGSIVDSPPQNDGMSEFIEALGGEARHTMQLRQVTRALEAAAGDKAIKGLYLTGAVQPVSSGSGYATLKEVRRALEVFKASGKPVKAYLRFAGTRDVYLASTATELTLDPYGVILIPGLASQPMFFAGAFEKFGVGVQVTRVGKYKSAVEPYTRKDMSPESREQIQKLIDDVWQDLTVTIEGARNFPPGTLQKIVDTRGFVRSDTALENKLVDRVAYHDEILDELKKDTGRKGGDKPFKQINLREYSKLVGGGLVASRGLADKIEVSTGGKGRVAIVYAEGEIVDGNGHEEGYVFGERTARLLREIRQNDDIKAVVLRVNSPGGSVTASETIARELALLQKSKALVISMGSLAASGGYWIATSGDRIFAEPTTITGSIGVFGIFMNFQGLLNDKLGLTFDTVKTGKHSDFLTVTRPKTPEELAIFQDSVDWVYDQFLTKVTKGRKLDRAVVEEIAQGRVWSGTEALKLGLVDELGGLAAATKYAADRVKLGDNFRVTEYPRPKQFMEQFTEALDPRRREQTLAGPLGLVLKQATDELKTLSRFNDPRGLYARLPFDLSLR